MIADRWTGKNSGLPKLSFHYSALLHFFGLILLIPGISKRRNYQIMGVNTDTDAADSELQNSKLQHAVDFSENSGSRIAAIDSGLR
jgi:hypothetical protein